MSFDSNCKVRSYIFLLFHIHTSPHTTFPVPNVFPYCCFSIFLFLWIQVSLNVTHSLTFHLIAHMCKMVICQIMYKCRKRHLNNVSCLVCTSTNYHLFRHLGVTGRWGEANNSCTCMLYVVWDPLSPILNV